MNTVSYILGFVMTLCDNF